MVFIVALLCSCWSFLLFCVLWSWCRLLALWSGDQHRWDGAG